MSGQLHQIRLDYVATEDRLRLLISTRDKTEYRLWITRRFAQGFWTLLERLMTADASVQAQGDDEGARKAVLAYKHAKATPDESFGKPYDAGAETRPLGDAPALVTGCRVSKGKEGGTRLVFQLADKREVGIGVNDTIVHSLAKLLADVMPTTGWSLDFKAKLEEAEAARPARVH